MFRYVVFLLALAAVAAEPVIPTPVALSAEDVEAGRRLYIELLEKQLAHANTEIMLLRQMVSGVPARAASEKATDAYNRWLAEVRTKYKAPEYVWDKGKLLQPPGKPQRKQ